MAKRLNRSDAPVEVENAKTQTHGASPPATPNTDPSKWRVLNWDQLTLQWLKSHEGTPARHLIEAAQDMYAALRVIERWGPFPEVEDKMEPGKKISYGSAYGSNGERDYMRGIALDALAKAEGK